MSWLECLFSPGTIERLGWMLVHVLWQATAIAVLLAVFLRLLRGAGANIRYGATCAALALMVVLPVVTLQFIEIPGPVAEAGPQPTAVVLPTADVPTADSARAAPAEYWNDGMMGKRSADPPTPRYSSIPPFPSSPVPLRERIVSALEPALPYLVVGWLVGVFGLSAWHLGGWTQLQRLKRRMVREIGAPLHRKLEELGLQLGVARAVGLLESALVEVPTVVGWLHPVILLPASALTGLRPEQLEAILAHELAHIRRYDYLVNILQTVVEILGFYHPAVWWVSHRIRIERENCCDDLAVQVCGSSLQYARALACMEEIRHSAGDLAVAATGGSLMARIARLLGRPVVEDRRFAWLPGLIALLLVVGLTLPAALVLGTPQGAQIVEPAAAAVASAGQGAPEPSTTQQDAQSGSAPTSQEVAQILLEFRIMKVPDDLRLDRETLLLMANALGAESRLARELLQPDRTLDLTLGEILKGYVAPQSLSDEAVEAMINLLQSRRYLDLASTPRILLRDGKQAQIRLAEQRAVLASDPSGNNGKIEHGVVMDVTAHVRDDNRVAVKLRAEISDPVPGRDANRPAVARTSAETNLTARNDRHLIWAAIELPATTTDPEANQQSTYIMVKPHIIPPPQGLADAASKREPVGAPPRQVLLEVRTVTMEHSGLVNLGVEWSWPRIQAGVFSSASGSPPSQGAAGSWPYGVQVGYTPDRQFTNSLLDALALLQEKGQAHISAQQILAQEGHQSEIQALTEEWFTATAGATKPSPQSHKAETGTVVTITPRVGNNGDITLQAAIEVSALSGYKGSDLPLVTRRTTKNAVTIRDGGTVALAGLAENRTGANDKTTREIAIFVTAHLVHDSEATLPPVPSVPGAQVKSDAQTQAETERTGSSNETRRVRLNYTTALRAKALLSPIFAPYVQAETPNSQDPNDQGNTLVVTAAPNMIDRVVADIRRIDHHFKRQVLLDARVVVMEPADLRNLGAQWSWPKIQAGVSTSSANSGVGTTNGGWPYGMQIGYAPNRTFTDSLMMTLNQLAENGKADVIANPKVVAQDGRRAEMKVIQQEWFMMTAPDPNSSVNGAKLSKVESGTVLAITPYIGDNNDITLQMTVEVSDSTPKARGTDLPLITRRMAKNSVTVKDGGTVAVGGLTQNRNKSGEKSVPDLRDLPLVGKLFQNNSNDKANREIAVFVTAHLLPDARMKSLDTSRLSEATKRESKGNPSDEPATQTSSGPAARSSKETTVTATLRNTDLLSALAEISKHTGVNITPDATVKATPVTVELVEASPEMTLKQALKNTPYIARRRKDGTYLVFRPLSFTFPGVELVQALQDLAAATDVTIIPDPNVAGMVDASLKDVSLDEALEILLAGKPYVFKGVPDKNRRYYVIADRNSISTLLSEALETRLLRLNHIPSSEAKQLLSPIFAPYVQRAFAPYSLAEPSRTQNHYDEDNMLVVKAPPGLIDQIVAEIKQIDRVKRQVLLNARVVAMEPSDLQNLPLTWEWLRPPPPVPPLKTPMGYVLDRASTGSLMMTLNQLQENHRVDIVSDAKLMKRDGERLEMRVAQGQWLLVTATGNDDEVSLRTKIRKRESGTVLVLTPTLGDQGDIMLTMTLEVSDPIPKVRGGFYLPGITRRAVTDAVTIKDGGTIVVTELTEDPAGPEGNAARPVTVFLTASLVPDTRGTSGAAALPGLLARLTPPNGDAVASKPADEGKTPADTVWHGRVLFEDGSPAILVPTPWPGAVTRVWLAKWPTGTQAGPVDADGYFAIPLKDSERKLLADHTGPIALLVEVPMDRDRCWEGVGVFPFEKLARTKQDAGVLKVRRPLPRITLPPELRRGRPLPQGWKLEFDPAQSMPDRLLNFWPGSSTTGEVLFLPRVIASGTKDLRPPADEEFVIYDGKGKEVERFGMGAGVGRVDKTGLYTLIARKGEGRGPDDWHLTRGPYRLDLRAPGMYTLYLDVSAPAGQDRPGRSTVGQGSKEATATTPRAIADQIVAGIQEIGRLRREVLLDARVVVLERGDLLSLGVEWDGPKIVSPVFTDRARDPNMGTVPGDWFRSMHIGYAPDHVFTDSLMMTLNQLKENGKADIIANPKVIAQDGRQAEMRLIQEEWFMVPSPDPNFSKNYPQLAKIESGTVLAITPHIGDNNDITLQVAVEVSDSMPTAHDSNQPAVTRRTLKNTVTVKDGGTVAICGLTENRNKNGAKRVPDLGNLPLIGKLFQNKSNDKANREIVVFVTVHLIPEPRDAPQMPLSNAPATQSRQSGSSPIKRPPSLTSFDEQTR